MTGHAIKKLRRRKKLTQDDLAKWLGVSRQAVAMWETGKRELKASTLKKIAHVFGTTVDEILIQNNNELTKKGEVVMAKKGKQKKIDFELMVPEAQKVALAGDFNSWDENGITMKKDKKGLWKTSVKLQEGRYEYKFIVDSAWWTDPNNDNKATNSFGDLNSVKEVTV